jgi:DNA-binding MarR family transcriptional regulator
MDRTTLTAALKPLERRGLLAVNPDPNDRRSRLITLTREGTALLAEAVPIWKSTHRDVETLTGGDAERLRRQMRALEREPEPSDAR